MKFLIEQLTLINFKGIRELVINFNHWTNVYGANEAGKTTIQDAFRWLLFGKDSTDRTDFQIKTVDSRGKVIPKIEHEVSARCIVDGEVVTLKKVLREKWQKKRSALEPEFTGNENLFFWNDVPLKESEYQKKIGEMIKENIFKLITNPLYYNSLKWQDRRQVLIGIAGEINDNDVANGDTAFEQLLATLGRKTLEEFKKETAANKKRIKDQLDTIPTRIDEANRSLPDPVDFPALEKQLKQLQEDLQVIDAGLQNEAEQAKQTNNIIADKIRQRGELQNQVLAIEHKIRSEINTARANRESLIASKKRELRNLQDEAQNNAGLITRTNAAIETLEKEREELGAKWEVVNKEEFQFTDVFQFDENKCVCPTCKQRLPTDTIESSRKQLEENFNANREKLRAEFNTGKVNRIKVITDRGFAIAGEVESLKKKLASLGDEKANQAKITDLQSEIASLELTHTSLNESEATQVTTALATNAEIVALNKKASDLQIEIDALKTPNSKTQDELRERKANLTTHIDTINKQLAVKDQITRTKQRIADLEAEEKKLAQQIADLEGTEFTIQRFTKAKIDALEERINGRFKYVKFKMFEEQINGAEVETCETTYKGVPFSDLNNAGKVWAGIDIINTLSQHYNVSAPIFLDNREGVTAIPDTEAQLINLIVSASDKKLRIEALEMQEAV